MLVNRIGFMICTAVMMITLSIILKNPLIAGLITLVIVMGGYIIIAITRQNRRINLLEEACDPQAFLDRTEKQMKITGKNHKMDSYLNIDKAAGLIEMGEFQRAKEILLSVDKSILSAKNGTLLTYTINLIVCLYELEETDLAEEMFEKEMPVLSPVNKTLILAVKFLIADRLFFLKRYDDSRLELQQLMNEKLSKRKRLGTLYRLAQIDEKTGDMVSAQKKYKEVADKGNKLWIAIQARKRV